MTEVDEHVRALAAKETGADLGRGDIVLTPNDFRVKRAPRYYSWQTVERRYVAWINGARSVAAMETEFRLKQPPTGDFELVIAGLDHNAKPPCRIRILANGNTVFEGPNPFVSDRWTTNVFKVAGAFLRGNLNTLKIENIEDSEVMNGTPWFMLSYAVLRLPKNTNILKIPCV